MPPILWKRFPAQQLSNDSELKSNWDALSAQRLDVPFMCADVVGTALQVFGSGRETLFVGSVAGRVVAMFVLARRSALHWQTFQPSQLPLGTWVAASDFPLAALGRGLLQHALGMGLILSITQVDPLLVPRTDDPSDALHGDYIDTAWLDIAGNFEDYWAQRGKNLRQNLRKQRNKLAAEGTATAMRIHRSAAEMAPALTRYGALESAGWKAGQGTAIAADNAQGAFYTRVFEAAAARGEGLVFEYVIGDRTAAMNLCLLRAGVLVVLKTAYDESLPKSLSPAFLLREDELKHLFAEGSVRRVEYYGRVMDWHTKLTGARRTLYHLTVFRWAALKSLTQARRSAATARAAAAASAVAAAASASAAEPATTDS